MARLAVTVVLLIALLSVTANASAQGTVSYTVLLPLVVSATPAESLERVGGQAQRDRDAAATFLGGTRWDYPLDIVLDGKGDMYIAGHTYSGDFPVTPGAYDLTCGFNGDCDYGRYGHQADVFVAKISAKTGQLVYATYLGGAGDDFLIDFAVDPKGAVYLTGQTYSSMDFPTTPGVYNPEVTYGAYFVVKLSPQGTHLEYATILSPGMANSRALAVDKRGSVFVTGNACSEWFEPTPGAYHPGFENYCGVYAAQLNAAGSELVYATLIPASEAADILVDQHGNAYLTGIVSSDLFPATPGAFDTSLNDPYGDVFVVKLSAGGKTLLFATLLGGSGVDYPVALDVNQKGSVVVAGRTSSTDFPVTRGSYRQQPEELFVAKLNPAGTGLDFATYLGGSEQDSIAGVQFSSKGEVYVTGHTGSPDFPVTPDALDQTCGSDGLCNPSEIGFPTYDGYLSRFDANGTRLTYSTFIGGSQSDGMVGLALSPSGSVYFTGGTESPDFMVTPGMFDLTYNGDGDIFAGWLRIK